MRRFKEVEWEAVAGVAAAVIALILHLLHVVDIDVLITVILVLLALLLLGGIRRDSREERIEETARVVASDVGGLLAALTPPDAILIGPRALRTESERFASAARGDMTWFNVCLKMFVPQDLFDAMLRPAIENPAVRRIRFVLDERERDAWTTHVLPKVAACSGADKVDEPVWRALPETVSFILASTDRGETEAHLSFWGEPFMAHSAERDLPRYIFHVLGHSELIARLVDVERDQVGLAGPTHER
jgi:hypothetical protein